MAKRKQKNPRKRNIHQKGTRMRTRSQTKMARQNNNISMPPLRFPNTIKADVRTGLNMSKEERLRQHGKFVRIIKVPQITEFSLDGNDRNFSISASNTRHVANSSKNITIRSKNKNIHPNNQKKRRCKPGTLALREIRRYQKTNDLLIKKISFQRMVREITKTMGEYRFQSTALLILHEALESYMISLFEDTNLCTIHRNAVTITAKDLKLASRIRGK